MARAAIKGPGSVEYGFKWLQGKTIVIDRRRTPNAYNEITKYEYARDKDGNVMSGYPEGQEDHIIAPFAMHTKTSLTEGGTAHDSGNILH
ncbi:hypothetical protein [Blautia sp. LMAG:75]|uniref:hypothetical protein n=1 Tax=Blautia sp. LMAG:75 TaxID=1969171 RepID=UPI0025BA7E44|nr:hypothetical protein [Blautia sp. LMAG:75]